MDIFDELDAQEAAAGAWPVLASEPAAPRPLPRPCNVAQALGQVPGRLRDALESAGAVAPGVLRGLFDGSRADAEKLVEDLLPGLGADELLEAVDSMLWLRELAVPEAAARRRRFEYLEDGVIVQEVLAGAAAKAARVERARVEAEVRGADAAWRPAARPARFRLRMDARLAAAAGPAARAEAELLERDRWKSALAELILEAGGPVVEATRQSADQLKALGAAAAGRRARTLCKRVGAWRRIRAWCWDVYSVPFPRAVTHLLEYLQARADEPCGLSALQGVAAAFSFMETCCGFQAGQRLVDQPMYEAYLKEMLAGYQGPCAGVPRQAPRYPLALVLAFEREVVDVDVATCYRLFSWWHLLAVWASLRFDDHRGLAPHAITFTPRVWRQF